MQLKLRNGSIVRLLLAYLCGFVVGFVFGLIFVICS
jgi:ABC-type nitrate/sulfonate/bicarbonate transport system permease component